MRSVELAFGRLRAQVIITSDAAVISKADGVILPGVGAFGDAAEKLRDSGLAEVITAQAASGKPLLGICLGMQLLFEKSYEYGEHDGLGLIKGDIVTMEGVVPSDYKVPHIGWNSLRFPKGKEKSPLFKYIEEGDFVYFVHTYFGTNCEDSVIATTEYGAELTAAVARDNVYGVQFHPEKSGDVGMKILKGFITL